MIDYLGSSALQQHGARGRYDAQLFYGWRYLHSDVTVRSDELGREPG